MIASNSKKTDISSSSSNVLTSTLVKPSGNNIRGRHTGTLPARMMPGASQLSLTTKQRIRAKPQEYSQSPAASFQEITRLISLNDEQKQVIVKMQAEIKTLKIVWNRGLALIIL